MTLKELLGKAALVFLGGGLGSVGRFLLSSTVQRLAPAGNVFPWGTFMVNMVGCCVIGALWAYGARCSAWWVLFLFTGLLGGFTTFSSFGLETVLLLQNKAWQMALLYVSLTNLFGVVLAFVGFQFVFSFLKG